MLFSEPIQPVDDLPRPALSLKVLWRGIRIHQPQFPISYKSLLVFLIPNSGYILFPIIPCNLCGSQPNLQRQVIKEMMQQWDKKFPDKLETMFTALQNVQLSHLADTGRYDFANLKPHGIPCEDENKAFDEGASWVNNMTVLDL